MFFIILKFESKASKLHFANLPSWQEFLIGATMTVTDTASLQYTNTKLNARLNSVNKSGMSKPEETKLKDACKDFEALFIKQMLDTMRKTVNKSGMLDGGMAEDVFEDMLYDKYALSMAETGDFGIADMMYSELSGLK